MSTIFNNIEPSMQTPLTRNDGWEDTTKYDVQKINKIKDTQQGGGIGYYKLGTSIPTPFARILMFNHAFNSLTNMGDADTIYGKLVSECLDFLEFIFHYGDELTIKKWSFTDDINLLKDVATSANATDSTATSSFDLGSLMGDAATIVPSTPTTSATRGHAVSGHSLLASSLLNKRSELKDIDNIYLIYYHGVLMGGTSPYTIVFTSPNWQRKKNCGTVKGDANNELFPNYQDDKVKGTPLHKRDFAFIRFLITYRRAYGEGVQDCSLVKYIERDMPYIGQSYPQLTNFDTALAGAGSAAIQAQFGNFYLSKEYQKAPIYAKQTNGSQQLPIVYLKPVPVSGSDYTIKSDYPNFNIVEYASDGSVKDTHFIENALVLSEGGLPSVGGVNANYVNGHPWNRDNNKFDHNIADIPLYNRILPGAGNHPQPFITVYDFFEDYLVRVPYSLNNERFETYVSGDWKYLLPVKRLFFNFFKIERLKEDNFFSISEKNGEVTFKMNVPVTFNPGGSGVAQFLTLEKTYDTAHIKDLRGGSRFAMALFPAYRVMNDPTENHYTLMVDTASIAVELGFFDATAPQQAFRVEKEVRPDEIKSQFYRVAQAFDFIELTPAFTDMAKPVHALIVPKLHQAYLDANRSNWEFSIDFGTTNTYIAAMRGGEPETFEITEQDMQVAYLDKIDYHNKFGSEEYNNSIGASGVAAFHTAAHREFAPLILCANGIANYPFPTVTCESSVFKDATGVTKNLFSQLSIGYNMNNEEFSDNYIYRTDIKWAVGNGNTPQEIDAAKERIRLYCQQIAWMLKNKVAMSSSDTNHQGKHIKVYFTYPCSMNIVDQANLESTWRTAFGSFIDGNNNLVKMTESEAPYYFLTRAGDVAGSSNFLNIDIGGGTTDMFFVVQETNERKLRVKRSYYTSMRFAGNDLWGDGVSGTAHLTNGFYQAAKKGMPWLLKEVERQEKLVTGRKDSRMTSADTMSFLFRNDSTELPKIPTIIKSNKQLYPLLFVHFGAILYHVATILKAKNWDIPRTINLTGMGSKYVYIIHDSEEVVTHLSGLLLKHFTGKTLPADFKLTYSKENAKQITAQGALKRDAGAATRDIEGAPKEFCIYGAKLSDPVHPDDPLYYEDADKDEIRDQILTLNRQFINDFLRERSILNDLRSNFGLDITDDFVDSLEAKAADSYSDVSDSFTDKKLDIKETLFFWPLKNAIYEMSKNAICQQQRKQ